MNERVTLVQDAGTPWETDEEAVEYAKDPKAYLLKRCSDLMSKTRLDSNHILVATYFPPGSTKMKGPGGTSIDFILTDKTMDEAKWQSRVGLLLGKGPLAWVSDDSVKFGGSTHEIGAWVVYDRQDGRQIAGHRVHCRKLKDVDIWCETDDPFLYY